MFENTITLAVDTLNNGTTANEEFRRHDDAMPNRSVYIGPGHLLEKRHTLGLYRTPPKKAGASKGVAKSAVKLTIDVEVDGVDSTVKLTAPLLVDLGFSIPVGVTKAQLVLATQRMVAFIDNDDFIERLALKQEV